MSKNLKLLLGGLIIVFFSFSLAFSVDKEKVLTEREGKVSEEKAPTPTPREVVIPESENITPQNYHIPWSSLNGGGLNSMSSTNYGAMVSSAQSFIGETQSTNYKLGIGYWYGGKPFMCGDANGSVNVSISDIVYLLNYLFNYGPEPDPLYCGDANGDDKVTISDCVYLINYLFKFGPAPIC